jgi:serine/threonine-protein kinase
VSETHTQLAEALGPAIPIVRPLGSGETETFVVHDAGQDRELVATVLPRALAGHLTPGTFARELANAIRLDAPGIVPVLSGGELADGRPYYTMPYVPGAEPLAARMARGGLTLADVVAILRDIAAALAFAHRRSVTHRAVTPATVLVVDHTAMVTSFGVAKALGTARTDAAVRLGTPAYMAPEQAAGHPADSRTDLYAWGIIAYELLAGRHPFADRTTDAEMLAAPQHESPAPLADATTVSGARVPASLATLVMQCLRKDQSSRVASAQALLEALETPGLLTAPPPRPTPPPRVPSFTAMDRPVAKPAPPAWRSSLVVGLAALLVALVAVSLLFVRLR